MIHFIIWTYIDSENKIIMMILLKFLGHQFNIASLLIKKIKVSKKITWIVFFFIFEEIKDESRIVDVSDIAGDPEIFRLFSVKSKLLIIN